MFSDSHISKVGPSQDNNPKPNKRPTNKTNNNDKRKKTSQGPKKL